MIAERLRRLGVGIDDEEIGRQIAARRRAVDDGLAIGHEARVGDRQAVERPRLEAHDAGGRGRRAAAPRPCQARRPPATAAAIAERPAPTARGRHRALRRCRCERRRSARIRHRLEREGDVARRLEALRGILLEAAAGDSLERRRDGAGRQLRRIVLEHRVHRLDRGGAARTRGVPDEHLVEHGAEREDVAAMVGGLAAHLLRATCSRRCPAPCPARSCAIVVCGSADSRSGAIEPARGRSRGSSRARRW